MQDAGYGFRRILLPSTSVNKPFIDAPNPFGWHYSCDHGNERKGALSYSNLIRLGGIAAMVGGVLYAGVGLLEEHLAEDLVFTGNIGYRIIVVSLPLGTMAAIVPCMPCTGTATVEWGGCFA